MSPVYYYDEKSRTCPVRDYLAELYPSQKDKPKVVERKKRLLSEIDRRIRFVAEKDDIGAGEVSEHLQIYSLSAVRCNKDDKTLIRIIHFRHEDKMVLLHVIEKPRNYDTKKAKSDINRELQLADMYRSKFLSKLKYEKYK